MSDPQQPITTPPWRRSIRAQLVILTLVPLIVGASGVAAFMVVAREQHRAEAAVRETLTIRAATQQASSALEQVETANTARFFGDAFASMAISIEAAQKEWDESLASLRSLSASDPGLPALIDRLEHEVQQRDELTEDLLPRLLDDDGQLDLSALASDPSLMLTFEAPNVTFTQIQTRADDRLTAQTAAVAAARSRLQTWVPIMVSAGLILSMLLALRAGRRLGRRVGEVEQNARRLAHGDGLLPFSPGPPDEVGRLAMGLMQAADLLATREAGVRESMESAERANVAKSEFLSRMSHELRTPLNSILGFGQLLQLNDTLKHEDADSVDKIVKAGRHLLGLIDEVLDVARIEAGAMELSIEPVDLDMAVRGALDLVAPLANAKGITISWNPPEFHARRAMADLRRLNQVLLNLLSNAIKYNHDRGDVFLALSPDGDNLRLKIADTGRGLNEDQINRLFTPFERLQAEQAGIEGTGLGLALSKRLVEAMNGTLAVEATPGIGSTFTVVLPMAPALDEAEENDDVVPTTSSSARHVVLYIEDNLANVGLVERLVARREGITLLSAMQGRLGLELARQHQPDLVLLDLHLPDLSGEEVVQRLREDPRTAMVPIVVISADATPRRVEKLQRAGVRAYLTKPIDIGRFLAVLDENLAGVGESSHQVPEAEAIR